MGICRATCSRGTSTKAPWSKLDRVLLALAITSFAISAIFAVTVFQKRKHEMMDHHHHHRHHHHHGGPSTTPPSPFMEETDCQVEDIDDKLPEMECARNAAGEWCAAPAPIRNRRHEHSHEDREDGRPRHHGGPAPRGGRHPERDGSDSHEGGMRPPPPPAPVAGQATQEDAREPELPDHGVRQEERRHFPCMRMRVRWQHRERMIDATAHENETEATRFPGCSFSSCNEDPNVNRMRMEELRRLWETRRHQSTRCLVNQENPRHVIILGHRMDRMAFFMSHGCQVAFWTFAAGVAFLVALVVRRCRSKKTETKKQEKQFTDLGKVNPVKLPGGAYLVNAASTDGMSDKEKEAFGFSAPVVSDNPVPGAPKAFLMLAPPAYDVASSDMNVQPPAYDTTPEKQV